MLLKRFFDFFMALILLFILGLPLLLSILIATLDTRSFGLFYQKRIGQYAKPFIIFKIKTIHPQSQKISSIGKFFRKYKIDELPQLFNILIGDMSFVGFRPDVEGYYDYLPVEDSILLQLKPGLTSEASIKYANEEELLNSKANPLQYNDEVIFPDKVKMNKEYYYNRSFLVDLQIIFKTIRNVV